MNAAERTAADEIRGAVRGALEEMRAHEEQEKAVEKAKAERKERLTNRVSIAAICLTMLLSFLNFARGEREGASGAASGEAAKAQSDADANWSLYQTRQAERGGYVVADDALAREVEALPPDDARVQIAVVQHAEYYARIAAIDQENRQVFFLVQDLKAQQVAAQRRSAEINRSVDRYDMGVRVLTLAVVLLSVTLLANRAYLFWVGVGIALLGAAIAVNGYFVFV